MQIFSVSKIETFAKEYRVSRAVIARMWLYRILWISIWAKTELVLCRSGNGGKSRVARSHMDLDSNGGKKKQAGKQGGSGGNFYASLRWRSGGRTFSLALDRSVQNMETSYKKAFRLLNIKGSTTTFTKYMEYIKKLHEARHIS